ncbi:GGDEF domain-containing protein [Massilia sp. RP-1-19]|uniref:diguanylate cyclase n=1 Tax=Massilia polaris TaxID=2728846 RepID=A0A848HIP2_9BURK|nr:GGDEF domain-containing protein [Massilia polaris]NML61736.1 GGDEF domain-containing protein [Massilia polaris]
MALASRLRRLLLGSDPRLARMLGYWAATCLLYLIGGILVVLQVRAGAADRDSAMLLVGIGVAGVAAFALLVRASGVLRISPSMLAVWQALYAIACNIGAYVVTGPLRGVYLIFLLVVMVFCAFSLRPRHTILLCASTLAMLGATMLWLVASDRVAYPAYIEGVHFVSAACALVSVTLLTGEMSKMRLRMKQQKEDLLDAMATIRQLATLDELTSLANRRHMNEVLVEQERRHDAAGQPTCIALIDLDFFKSVNDRYGHAAGDAVLRAFSNAARSALRSQDVLARWGGEEFLLLLPGAPPDQARMVVRRMAERVAAAPLTEVASDLRITFSAGIAQRQPGEPFADTITRADKALYDAKSSGRNRIREA